MGFKYEYIEQKMKNITTEDLEERCGILLRILARGITNLNGADERISTDYVLKMFKKEIQRRKADEEITTIH